VTREPGDLPLISVVARAGCLGADRFSIKHPVGASPRGASRVNSIGQPSGTDAAASTDAATVYVCITCRHPGEPESEPRPGAILAAATAQAAECSGVVIRPVRCLANCTRGLSAAVRCHGSWTYVFGGLDAACGPALVDGARLLASASDGIMPWRGRPQALKRGLIARVPPLDFKELE
jgi:predicted metal-binding protein